MTYRLLLVDDEPGIRECLSIALGSHDFVVREAGSLKAARALLAEVDLVVLDLSLPDGDGIDFLRDIHRKVPVLVLTSRDSEVDRIVGLEIGADDYVAKPFSPREVVARIRSILRRHQSPTEPSSAMPIQTRSGLILDPITRRATVHGKRLSLSKTEFELLSRLARSPERVFSRSDLLDAIWGDDSAVTDRSVDAHIKSIRKKLLTLGANPSMIESVRGVGYRLTVDTPSA